MFIRHPAAELPPREGDGGQLATHQAIELYLHKKQPIIRSSGAHNQKYFTMQFRLFSVWGQFSSF